MTLDAPLSADELRESPLFKQLSPADVEQFLEGCEKCQLPMWSKVFQAGETKRSLYLLVKGTVEILLDGLGDQPSVLAELHAGDVFGEACFFHAAPHHSTAVCTSDVVLLELSRAKYDEMLERTCALALRIGTNAAEILAGRLHALDEWVQHFLTGHHQEDWHTHLTAFRKRLTHPTSQSGFMAGGGLNTL